MPKIRQRDLCQQRRDGRRRAPRLRAGLRVPQDLSIIGFDDTAIAAHIWPPLTTVRWPIRAMARTAALKLIRPETAARDRLSSPPTSCAGPRP
jgi:DNA-binding LacI/PurR family transcriptional regulator